MPRDGLNHEPSLATIAKGLFLTKKKKKTTDSALAGARGCALFFLIFHPPITSTGCLWTMGPAHWGLIDGYSYPRLDCSRSQTHTQHTPSPIPAGNSDTRSWLFGSCKRQPATIPAPRRARQHSFGLSPPLSMKYTTNPPKIGFPNL